MGRFARSRIGMGLFAGVLLIRFAVHFGATSGIMLIAGGAIAIFATAIFQTLVK